MSEFTSFRRSAEDDCGGGFESAQQFGKLRISHRADDYEVVGRTRLPLPNTAVQNGDARSLPLRLPAGGQQTRKFGFIGKNQYVRVSQERMTPKFVALRMLDATLDASSMLEFFCFVQCGQQTLGANAKVHGRLGIFSLLSDVDSLLQASDFDAGHRQGLIQRGGISRSLGGF